jgi:hypothetical protein
MNLAAPRTAILFNPIINPWYFNFLREMGPAKPGTLEIAPMTAQTVETLHSEITELGHTEGPSLIMGPDAFVLVHVKEIAALAMEPTSVDIGFTDSSPLRVGSFLWPRRTRYFRTRSLAATALPVHTSGRRSSALRVKRSKLCAIYSRDLTPYRLLRFRQNRHKHRKDAGRFRRTPCSCRL